MDIDKRLKIQGKVKSSQYSSYDPDRKNKEFVDKDGMFLDYNDFKNYRDLLKKYLMKLEMLRRLIEAEAAEGQSL